MTANTPSWLVDRPIAHRGLHSVHNGVIENTLGAAQAAVDRGFGLECDVQMSSDGEAFVFHDETLDRLTHFRGALIDRTARDIAAVSFRSGSERIPTFQDLLDRVAGRSPIICEIKSGFDSDFRLADRVVELAAAYRGPLAIKSFDPAIIAYLRAKGRPPGPLDKPCPLGVVAQARYGARDWPRLTPAQRRTCEQFLHFASTRPDFLSWSVDDLPHATPLLLRALSPSPVMVWTVRTRAQKALAAQWADQIVFQGDVAD